MSHKIEISDKTYEDLKEFCNLNTLKIGQLADKLIHEGLMIEMYGDVPFTNYRIKIKEAFPPEKFRDLYMADPEPVKTDSTDNAQEQNEVKFLEEPPVQEEYIKEKEKLEEKILEEVGVPRKVMNRITKRRLK